MKKYKGITIGLILSSFGLPFAANGELPWVVPADVEAINSTGRDGTIHVSTSLKEAYLDRTSTGANLELWRSTRDSSTAEWGTPVQVSELNDVSDASAYLSLDRLSIWWQRYPSGASWRIYTATRNDVDSAWENVAEVSELTVSGKITGTPVVSFDELTMWFESDRSGGEGGLDIWVATRDTTSDDWENITNETDLNSSSTDTPAWISANELLMYMASERDGDRDIYEVRRTSKTADWGTVTAVDDLNSTSDDKKPILSPSRLLIWFGSERTGGTGGDDIWASVRPLACEGDVNFDGTVDPLDLGFVTARHDCTVDLTVDWQCFWADVNGDDVVDPLDNGYVLARYGDCP